jgi:hypothetical protein
MKKFGFLAVCAVLGGLTIPQATHAQELQGPFVFNFNQDGILEETADSALSSSPYFWLASGAELTIADGIGSTIHGQVNPSLVWRSIYQKNNSADSEDGLYPQNLFKLLTKNTWGNLAQEISFRIDKTNPTDTLNRDGLSGFFFLSRYSDPNNFYYAGVRMDGGVVIKKKTGGIYYTLGSAQVFGNKESYDKHAMPNLLPTNTWLRMRSETKDLPDGDVAITLSLDIDGTGFKEVLRATDHNGRYGKSLVLRGPARAGIRSDFMDMSFEDYTFIGI